MAKRLKQVLVASWVVLAFLAALVVPQAHAGLITMEDLERERVKAMLERPELTSALTTMGIVPEEAAARVDSMSDTEVLQLAGRLDAALAGGQLRNDQLLLIIIILLLLIIIL